MIPCLDALSIVDQNQIGRVKAIISVHLNECLKREIESSLQEIRALIEYLQAGDVMASVGFVRQIASKGGHIHGCDMGLRSRSISSVMSVMPITAISHSK